MTKEPQEIWVIGKPFRDVDDYLAVHAYAQKMPSGIKYIRKDQSDNTVIRELAEALEGVRDCDNGDWDMCVSMLCEPILLKHKERIKSAKEQG